MPTVTELIADARQGGAEALETLLEQYRPFVQLVVRCRLPGKLQRRMDSSDIVQETLLRAAQAVEQFQGENEEQWRAWLGRIAEREVIRQNRRHLAAQRRDVRCEHRLKAAEGSHDTGYPKLDQWLAQSQTSPSMAAMRKERAVWLSQSLAKLSDDHREVLILRHIEGLDFPDVAARLNRTPGAVRVLWVRALKKLREIVADSRED